MLFDKSDDNYNEMILFQTKPSLLFGCKKAIFAAILLVIVLMISQGVIQFIANMQVYLISYITLPLTRFAAIAFFVIILFIVLYIIWQLLGWYATEYILTDTRMIIKSGVISTKKNYMPYATIQDINTSQNIFARMFGVGSISAFSAYDNNKMEFSNIHDTSKAEDIIFSHMRYRSSFQAPPEMELNQRPQREYHEPNDNYSSRNEYYDEFEPITPINREKDLRQRKYEYYPEDFNHRSKQPKHYEYEGYDSDLAYETDRNSMHSDEIHWDTHSETKSYNRGSFNPKNERLSNSNSESRYYDEVKSDYSNKDDKYYHDSGSENHKSEWVEESPQNQNKNIVKDGDSSEKAIQRHFDKFKK